MLLPAETIPAGSSKPVELNLAAGDDGDWEENDFSPGIVILSQEGTGEESDIDDPRSPTVLLQETWGTIKPCKGTLKASSAWGGLQ